MSVFKLCTFVGIPLILTGCGGGGGSATAPQYDYTLGTPSSITDARTAFTSSTAMGVAYTAPNNTTYSSLSAAHNTLNSGSDAIATVDTGAATAWASGWTGKGVKVGVVDTFVNNSRVDDHGDWVSLVVDSVAPESNIGTINATTLSAAASAWDTFESNGYHIINNSWVYSKSNSDWETLVRAMVNAYDPNTPSTAEGLYIFSSGNDAQTCGSVRAEDCNFFAAITDRIRDNGYTDTGSRTIFVGAIQDGSDTITSYSIQAGDLKYDFIVAHDDVLASGDAAGTSFSAPRVAGAAALVKHKFPNLTSAQIKQVLLQTATDIGAPGVDEVYGYGKLNIAGSLSPQGTVTPR